MIKCSRQTPFCIPTHSPNSPWILIAALVILPSSILIKDLSYLSLTFLVILKVCHVLPNQMLLRSPYIIYTSPSVFQWIFLLTFSDRKYISCSVSRSASKLFKPVWKKSHQEFSFYEGISFVLIFGVAMGFFLLSILFYILVFII